MHLMDHLPERFQISPETVAYETGLEAGLCPLLFLRDNCFQQLDLNIATWGLNLWEMAYGLQTEAKKPYEYRRNRIISKMRGQGTVTAAMIQNVAESFAGGDVEVIENSKEHRFVIKFVGLYGVPPVLNDLSAAIDEIKPAHLAYSYAYTYLTWPMVDTANVTFSELDALELIWTEFERGEWIDGEYCDAV